MENFTVALSPDGILDLLPSAAGRVSEDIRLEFEKGSGEGLKQLGLQDLGSLLPPDLGFWRDFSRLYFSCLCALPGLAEQASSDIVLLPPCLEKLSSFVSAGPPMMGGEYLNETILVNLWEKLHSAFLGEVRKSSFSIQEFFTRSGSAWNLVGRLCFHLAENKGSEETPFAFIATYSHRLSQQGKTQHLPLGRALEEYSGEKNKSQLMQLLLPMQRGAEKSPFLQSLVESGEVFHPLAWTPHEAFQFLKDIPCLESSGILVRVPEGWNSRKPARPQVQVTIGGKKNSILGLDAMLSFSVQLSLDGEELSSQEWKKILSETSGLAWIRGKWVEIDREKLKEVLDHWQSFEKASAEGGISFIQGMRLLSGAVGLGGASQLPSETSEWMQVCAGQHLEKLLRELKDPDGNLKEGADPGAELQAVLRPYQKSGVRWLWFLSRLGLGACLADDMGLGKTIQIISFFLLLKRQGQKGSNKKTSIPSLLVVPASLLGNWQSEIERFAPSLRLSIVHASFGDGDSISQSADVVMTTYGYLQRQAWISQKVWDCIVIDEAQAIKNPGSQQSRLVKSLKARHRIALTGTPVENHLSDLWSLYDFLCPGLLGSASDFKKFVQDAEKSKAHNKYAALRNLVRPYLLRRLKTDKRILTDLPDKTEVLAYCSLTKTQAVLYQQSVEDLAGKIDQVEGIQRRGVVLSFLMRLKQICNHPSQWLSDGSYLASESGKFFRLREICEDISAKQEKVLIFTQFREMTGPLSAFLQEIFGRPGLILQGSTAVQKRKELVDSFQKDRGPPFFVLSLKAGGTGLNLTAAAHVIHFDRWWNPAVENQATDRAYRIGQKKNVLVHKLICRGTVEEKIDQLIASKQSLSQEILEGSGETLLTELKNEELLKLVALDLKSAVKGDE